MYYLTLTKKDRDAIDWIGHRYSHGSDLRNILQGQGSLGSLVGRTWYDDVRRTCDDDVWNSDETLTFRVSEHVAWKIAELVREDGMACFSPKLICKFHDFLNKIV